MNKQTKILIILLLLNVTLFAQDTLRNVNSATNPSTLNTSSNHDTSGINTNPSGIGATINSNAGTTIPVTTSGTLNSSVNPNTQVVIPIGKNKKKSGTTATHDPALNAPKQNK